MPMSTKSTASILSTLAAIVLLLSAVPALADDACTIITYTGNTGWSDDGNSSWVSMAIDGVTKPRRIAVEWRNKNQVFYHHWDNPGDRTIPKTQGAQPTVMTVPDLGTYAKITAHTYAYEGQPWQAGTSYAVGDKLSVGAIDSTTGLEAAPSIAYWWECIRAGSSGTTRPTFATDPKYLADEYREITQSYKIWLAAEAIINNGDGTVSIAVGNESNPHRFEAGDEVRISGTTNYDGVYTLPDQSAGDKNTVIVTATYVAETPATSDSMWLTAGEAVNNGDGTVNVPCPAHGFVQGDSIAIDGVYIGTYTLPDQSAHGDADHITITATYTQDAWGSANGNVGKARYTDDYAVDNGNSTVTLAVPSHGFAQGDSVRVYGTYNYDGDYTLGDQSAGNSDHLVIAASYVGEFMRGSEFVTRAIDDPDAAGAQWVLTRASDTGSALQRLDGGGTGRLIFDSTALSSNGCLQPAERGGIHFKLRSN